MFFLVRNGLEKYPYQSECKHSHDSSTTISIRRFTKLNKHPIRLENNKTHL